MKLSACMMVRDEEKMLPNCLDSIKDYVDEIVAVDTGSKDRTVEILESYGAKVYHHPWEDDFALHRNQSIEYATGDWFLIIDPDEELCPVGLPKEELFKRFDAIDPNHHALLITVINKHKEGDKKAQSARFFRNGVGIHYIGFIHNEAVVPNGFAVASTFKINHYGYDMDEKTMECKFQRTSKLLYKRLDENPDDYEAHYYLFNLLISHGEINKALDHGARCLELVPDKEEKAFKYSAFHGLYYSIGMTYRQDKKDFDTAIEWIMAGLRYDPRDPDLNYAMVHIGATANNTDMVKTYGAIYLHLYDAFMKHPQLMMSKELHTLNPKYLERVNAWLRQATGEQNVTIQ